MGGSSFLDKGILLGYCFSIDAHHRECRNYLLMEELTSYYTQGVRDAFDENKERMIRDHRKEIFHHARFLEKSGFVGKLDGTELEKIRTDIISRSEYPNSWRYLADYYKKLEPTSVRQILKELREIAREIESNAHERLTEIEGVASLWKRSEDYPSVQTALGDIRQSKEEDLWICIDAHDLAERVDGHTELATTDFKDLIDRGRRELIIDNTSLDDVVGVGVTT